MSSHYTHTRTHATPPYTSTMSGFGANAKNYDIKLFQTPFYRHAAGPDPLRTYAAAATAQYRRNAPAIRDMRFRRSNEYDPDSAIRGEREDLISQTYFKNEKDVDLEGLRGRLGLQLSRTGGALGKRENKVLDRTVAASTQASEPPGAVASAVGDVVTTPKGETGVVDRVEKGRVRVTVLNPDGSPSKRRTWVMTPGRQLGGARQPTVGAKRMAVTSARQRAGRVSRLVGEYERGRSSEARMLSYGPEPKDATAGFTGPKPMGDIERRAKKDQLLRDIRGLTRDRRDPSSKFFSGVPERGGRRSGAGKATQRLPVRTPAANRTARVVRFADLADGTGAGTNSPSTLASAFGTGGVDFD